MKRLLDEIEKHLVAKQPDWPPPSLVGVENQLRESLQVFEQVFAKVFDVKVQARHAVPEQGLHPFSDLHITAHHLLIREVGLDIGKDEHACPEDLVSSQLKPAVLG